MDSDTLVVPARLSDWLAGPHLHVIDGERVASADGATFETYDPATGRALAAVAHGREVEIDLAVQAARRAFEDGSPWRRLSPAERERRIAVLADVVEAHADELAHLETLDNGKPLRYSRAVDVPTLVATLRYYAGWPTKTTGASLPISVPGVVASTRREPVGVCGQIIPWNFPLVMAGWKIAPALAAGCTVVLKPAEQTPLSALRLAELAIESGLPAGVLNVVAGDGGTGAALVAHPGVDKIAFTGSTAVGREIAATAGRALKRVTLELGGKSPNIVLPDADAAAVIKGSFTGMYFNSGQACNAPSRLLVPAARFDEIVSGIAERARATMPGPGLDPATFVGPLVSAEQHARVGDYIEAGREEADLVAGGATDLGDGGWFVEPTVFVTDHDDARIVREEIFGPVLVAQPYESLEEVAVRANNTEYGLAAGVWTSDIASAQRFAELLRAGMVYINGWGPGDPAAPFGGFKASGLGRENGEDGLAAYLETKTVFTTL